LLTPLSGGAVAVDRFTVFGVVAAADESDPDFLSLTVDTVDFLSPSPLVVPVDASSAVPALLIPAAGPASGPPVAFEESDDPLSPDDVDDALSSPADADERSFEDDESDDELDESESAGPAHATPGMVATATPTPKATANPPTRPTYLA
jgi:hypothetical protein